MFAHQEPRPEIKPNQPEEKLADVAERLKDLDRYLPNQPREVYLFAAFLASRVERIIISSPKSSFKSMAIMALFDLRSGKDIRTGKPIQSEIAKQPYDFYDRLEESISKIIEAIFGKEK
jgi:hypothetical protein